MTDVDRLIELTTQQIQDRLAASGTRVAVPHRGEPARTADAPVAPDELARLIDHTLLRPDATRDEIAALCDEARRHGFASVCVNSSWVPLCKALLADTRVMVCAVAGFPLGAMATSAKAFEAKLAADQGASEIDMVIQLGALRAGDHGAVFDDIHQVVAACAPARVKVILETSALDTEHKIAGCTLARLAGAAFVKTSTGFGKGGATVDDVALMRRVVGHELGVKASGGVRTTDDAIRMVRAGANRIGASASVAIVSGASDAARTKDY